MLPTVVFYIFELLLCLLCIVIVIPVCYFIFWDETREHFVHFAREWLRLVHSDAQMLVVTLWFALALGTGLYCAVFILQNLVVEIRFGRIVFLIPFFSSLFSP